MSEKRLTTTQAAIVLGVTPETLRNWRHRGRGPAFTKQGTEQQSRTYYMHSEVEAYMRDPVEYEARRSK